MNIVLPRAQGMENLSCHQDGGIAHVAVNIPEAQICQALVLRQQHRLPAPGGKGAAEKGKVVVQKGGNQQCPGSHDVTSLPSMVCGFSMPLTIYNIQYTRLEEKSQGRRNGLVGKRGLCFHSGYATMITRIQI